MASYGVSFCGRRALKRIILLLVLAGVVDGSPAAVDLSEASECGQTAAAAPGALASYEEALRTWKNPEEIHAWIAANFSYDMQRSMRFSETQVARQGPPAIYTPSEFFIIKSGTCVDLSRFAVETLRAILPQAAAKYLMIEFDPLTTRGNVLRRHWLASFERGGRKYFFADSSRPGLMVGPVQDPQEFIREYERARGRRVVAFREMDSYQKQKRNLSLKRPVAPAR